MACSRRLNTPLKIGPVPDQISGRFIPRKRFGDLPRDPFRRWMSRDIDPDKLAPSQPNDHQNVELNKADSRHHKQIHRCDLRSMVAQECAPTLTGRIIGLGHIPGDGRLSHAEAQLEQFAWMRGAPQSTFSRLIRRIKARNSG